MRSGAERSELFQARGFTLLELVLATLISSLIIGILSVSLTFSLRLWERQQNQETTDLPRMLDLIKMQLATFDPAPIDAAGENLPLFVGTKQSLAFATDFSVRALSRSVPIIARYVYVAGEKKLFYGEIPFDPYHPEAIQEFLELSPGNEDGWPRFYSVEISDFSLEYAGSADAGYVDSWEGEAELPQSVVIKWSPADDSTVFTQSILPGFLFPRSAVAAGETGDAFDTDDTAEEP